MQNIKFLSRLLGLDSDWLPHSIAPPSTFTWIGVFFGEVSVVTSPEREIVYETRTTSTMGLVSCEINISVPEKHNFYIYMLAERGCCKNWEHENYCQSQVFHFLTVLNNFQPCYYWKTAVIDIMERWFALGAKVAGFDSRLDKIKLIISSDKGSFGVATKALR